MEIIIYIVGCFITACFLSVAHANIDRHKDYLRAFNENMGWVAFFSVIWPVTISGIVAYVIIASILTLLTKKFGKKKEN